MLAETVLFAVMAVTLYTLRHRLAFAGQSLECLDIVAKINRLRKNNNVSMWKVDMCKCKISGASSHQQTLPSRVIIVLHVYFNIKSIRLFCRRNCVMPFTTAQVVKRRRTANMTLRTMTLH